jgi:hypothetical protein
MGTGRAKLLAHTTQITALLGRLRESFPELLLGVPTVAPKPETASSAPRSRPRSRSASRR